MWNETPQNVNRKEVNMSDKQKTADEILKQKYITAKDLQIIIPKLGYNKSLEYINDLREEMKDKNYFVPEGKTKVALTKLAKEKFGF